MIPLVSILIPAYNAAEWISQTLSSAIAQTWPNKEIIVVDDGSTDDTVAIARQFESHGVRILQQKNQGAASARNHAYSVSRGEYIQWLDADDLLAPDKISLQMQRADPAFPRVLFSCAWGTFIYRPAKAHFFPTDLWCDLDPAEWILRKFEQPIYMQTSSWLVSRELTEKAGPWNTNLMGDDDGEYFCRVIIASTHVRFVPEAKVFYRCAGNNRLSYVGTSNPKLEAHFLSMQLHVQYTLNALGSSERVRAALLTYLQRFMIYFYERRPDIVNELQKMAYKLGGHLHAPVLPWKYAWLQNLFGWTFARKAQLQLPQVRGHILSLADRALWRFEGGRR
ncbi:MAG TPA: glycosyltransferase family A protein [Verrucomicrobiae bacterium]